MSIDQDPIEIAFQRACAALDEAWQLVREHRRRPPPPVVRVDTLSTSLARPQEHQLEITLSSARAVIKDDADRASLIAVARICQQVGAISDAARDRLIQDFDRA